MILDGLFGSALAADPTRADELHAELTRLDHEGDLIVIVGLVDPGYVHALRRRARGAYDVFRLDPRSLDTVFVPRRALAADTDPVGIYAQLGGNGWTLSEIAVKRRPDPPASWGVTETAFVLGVDAAVPFGGGFVDAGGLSFFAPIPAASPVVGGEVDLGARDVGVVLAADLSPTLVYALSENGCCVALARATLALRLGDLESWVAGPYVDVGFLAAAAGMRVAHTDAWRRSGQPHGWELRVGLLAPAAVEVRFLYRRAHRSQ